MPVDELQIRRRPAATSEAEGLLILHHGRGADENDLLPLADFFDPERRLHVVTPRGPLTLPGWTGYHWYRVPRVGYPDPESFRAAFGKLSALHDRLWEETGIGPERTVLGGFSMGAVMSYALGLGPGRPAPAGILAFSGFIPTVEGWEPDLGSRSAMPVFISHGQDDPVIGIEFAHRARQVLQDAGLAVEYHEFAGGHQIDMPSARAAATWLGGVLSARH